MSPPTGIVVGAVGTCTATALQHASGKTSQNSQYGFVVFIEQYYKSERAALAVLAHPDSHSPALPGCLSDPNKHTRQLVLLPFIPDRGTQMKESGWGMMLTRHCGYCGTWEVLLRDILTAKTLQSWAQQPTSHL